jgi:hypothetical protein
MRSRIVPVLCLMLAAVMVSMIGGCGGSSGSDTAIATDSITGPASVTIVTAQCGGGVLYLYPPLQFYVKDTLGLPKNNITLTFFTGSSGGAPGPFWYTDPTYAAILHGSGAFNSITAQTQSDGSATVYWSTSVLPVANPAIAPIPPATSWTDGANKTGVDYATAQSGGLSYTYSVNWTVTGCHHP